MEADWPVFALFIYIGSGMWFLWGRPKEAWRGPVGRKTAILLWALGIFVWLSLLGGILG